MIAVMLDFLTFALCAPYSETTDGAYFDVLLEMVADNGRTLFRLFQVFFFYNITLMTSKTYTVYYGRKKAILKPLSCVTVCCITVSCVTVSCTYLNHDT